MLHTIRTCWVHTQSTHGGNPLKPVEDPLSVFGDISISLMILEYHPNSVRGSPNAVDNLERRN